MPRIRITEGSPIKVELCNDKGVPKRELRDPIGHVGPIDWKATVASCKAKGNKGLEIDLIPKQQQ